MLLIDIYIYTHTHIYGLHTHMCVRVYERMCVDMYACTWTSTCDDMSYDTELALRRRTDTPLPGLESPSKVRRLLGRPAVLHCLRLIEPTRKFFQLKFPRILRFGCEDVKIPRDGVCGRARTPAMAQHSR